MGRPCPATKRPVCVGTADLTLERGRQVLAQQLTARPTEDLDFFTALNAGAFPPTLAPEELAGHKLLALFDRAAARDFADVYVLAHRFGKDVLLARAAQIDAGFDV